MRRALDRTLKTAMRVVRVGAYFAAVSALLAVFAVRSVYGAVKESALEVGGELVKLSDVIGRSSRVRLNGEPVNVASTMTDLAVSAVLDRFEALCREKGGGLAEEIAGLPNAASARLPAMDRAVGVMRSEEDRRGGKRGMVACLAREGRGGSGAILRGVADFAATGDLAKIGKLRYVVAERSADGTRTHVITAWTDGAFHVARMFPAEGDAPGSDAPNAGRPGDARRLLTASIEGAPYSVRIYDAAGSPDSVLAQYDREMTTRGWAPIAGVAAEVKNGRAFSRDGVDLMVFAGADRDRAIVSVVEMPGGSR